MAAIKAFTNMKNMKKRSGTDWKRVDAMKDSDIDFSDIPKLGPDFFKNAILWRPRAERDERDADPDVSVPSKKVMADAPDAKPEPEPPKKKPKALRSTEQSKSAE
jgi:hypothetical protein